MIYEFIQGNLRLAVKDIVNQEGNRIIGTLIGMPDGGIIGNQDIYARIPETSFEASGTWTLIGFTGVWRDDIDSE